MNPHGADSSDPGRSDDSALRAEPSPSVRSAHGLSSAHMDATVQAVPVRIASAGHGTAGPDLRSDLFHPFPPGRGTGEQLVSGPSMTAGGPVPEVENGWGTGTGAGQGVHSDVDTSLFDASIPANRASVASAPLSTQPPQAGGSWFPADLSEHVDGLLSGTLTAPRPSVGKLDDGSHWLYAGATNGLAGESGCGKTWTALKAVAAELEDGNGAVYIDFENGPVAIASRLLDLGVDASLIRNPLLFAYVHPEEAFREDVRAGFWTVLDAIRPSLVVVDSTGESMAMEGTDPNSDDGVASWFQRVATAIASRGPAVLLLDHVPKSDSASSSPIGSQRKRAALSGVQVIQTVTKNMAFGKGRPGQAKLTVTKDRHGHFVTGEVAMTLTVNPAPSRGAGGIDVSLARPDDGDWAPTRQMIDVSDFLASQAGPQTTQAIKKHVKGKTETVLTALRVLVHSGYINASAGARNSTLYELVRPYALGAFYEVPDEPTGCEHPWHDGRCDLSWCHATHRGSCNEMVEAGYELDEAGQVLSGPPA